MKIITHWSGGHRLEKVGNNCPKRASNCKFFIFSGNKFAYNIVVIVKFIQLCSKFLPTALLNFACDG